MKVTWKERKDYLCKLIKQVSDEAGGDDSEWLREYAKEMINEYRHNLDVPIKCFEDLIRKEAKCIVHEPGVRSI